MRGRGVMVALALAIALGAGYLWGQSQQTPDAPPPLPPPVDLSLPEQATISLFQGARDSVVAIATSTTVFDPFTQRRTDQPVASGSGFFWDDSGHVVTNNHVIEGASGATVQLADGRSFQASLVGRDAQHDLAVLRIEGTGLPTPLPLGESGVLQVGQQVLAIGNPFGLDWTLTTGIVSALDRDLPGAEGRGVRGLIQTDAAINPGNSGGPLLDSRGRLIGVNTSIYSPSGASAGIGFAVPVATVMRIVPELIANGHYSPPSLGVSFDPRVNAAVNRQGLSGALVLDVQPGSDAAQAGLEPARMSRDGRIQPGHVIIALNDEPVDTLDDLLAALDAFTVGDTVSVTAQRDGKAATYDLELIAPD